MTGGVEIWDWKKESIEVTSMFPGDNKEVVGSDKDRVLET